MPNAHNQNTDISHIYRARKTSEVYMSESQQQKVYAKSKKLKKYTYILSYELGYDKLIFLSTVQFETYNKIVVPKCSSLY